jgi:hypothetical protein
LSILTGISPSRWERDHIVAVRQGVKYISDHDAVPDTPMWDMLVFRHDLNPIRFDHYHHVVGNALEELAKRRLTEFTCPPSYDHKAPCIPSIECRPEVPLHPQVVPEPGSVISLAIGLVLLVAFGMRNMR